MKTSEAKLSVSESQRQRVPIRTPSPRCSPITTSTTIWQDEMLIDHVDNFSFEQRFYLVSVVSELLDLGLDAV